MGRARGAVEPMEQDLGDESPVIMPTTGAARLERETPEIEHGSVMNQQWLADMQIMEEPVTVVVHESTDKYAEDPVRVGNNGVNQAFVRGEPVTVKRKFVYALAKARPIGYSQEVRTDASSGDVVERLMPKRALKYPFSIVEDRNPNGTAWLKKVLVED
jgi:hypothetical protein